MIIITKIVKLMSKYYCKMKVKSIIFIFLSIVILIKSNENK